MAFEIRRAQAADVDTIADLLRNLNYFHRLEGQSQEQVRAQVRRQLGLCLGDDGHSIYVAAAGDAPLLGYVAVHWLPYLFLPGPEGFVSELFVAETARGQGVGTRLLQAVKEEARVRGCARLSLLNMRERESYQRGFYSKDGWEERPDAANFVFDTSDLLAENYGDYEHGCLPAGQQHDAFLFVRISAGKDSLAGFGGARICRKVRHAGRDVEKLPCLHNQVLTQVFAIPHFCFTTQDVDGRLMSLV